MQDYNTLKQDYKFTPEEAEILKNMQAPTLANSQQVCDILNNPIIVSLNQTVIQIEETDNTKVWYIVSSFYDEVDLWAYNENDPDQSAELCSFNEIIDIKNFHLKSDDGNLAFFEGNFLDIENNIDTQEADINVPANDGRTTLSLQAKEGDPFLTELGDIKNTIITPAVNKANPTPVITSKSRNNRNRNKNKNKGNNNKGNNNNRNHNNKSKNSNDKDKVVSTVNNKETFNSIFYGSKKITAGVKVDRNAWTDALLGKATVNAAIELVYTTDINKLGNLTYPDLINNNACTMVTAYIGYVNARESNVPREINLAALLLVSKKLNVIFNNRTILIKLTETEQLNEVNDILDKELINLNELYICS